MTDGTVKTEEKNIVNASTQENVGGRMLIGVKTFLLIAERTKSLLFGILMLSIAANPGKCNCCQERGSVFLWVS